MKVLLTVVVVVVTTVVKTDGLILSYPPTILCTAPLSNTVRIRKDCGHAKRKPQGHIAAITSVPALG